MLSKSELMSYSHILTGNKIENNRPVSNYRRYSLIIIRKNSWPHAITDVTSVTGVTVLIQKMALEGSWSVVRGAHIQAFTFSCG